MAAVLTGLVVVHVALAYAAAERINVFTALCLMSLLSSALLGALVGAACLLFPALRDLAWQAGGVAFGSLLLVFTMQLMWEVATCGRRGQGDSSRV